VRGGEALDMLQAMNTGHDGSLTTIHANNPRDAIARLETMSLMAEINLPDKAIRQQIASAVSIIVQVARLSDGAREWTQISEVTGVSDDMVTLQDIFVFDRLGIGPNNRVLGRFRATGLRPHVFRSIEGIGHPASAEHIRARLRGFSRDAYQYLFHYFDQCLRRGRVLHRTPRRQTN